LGCSPVRVDRLVGRGRRAPVRIAGLRRGGVDPPGAPELVVVEDLALAGSLRRDGHVAGVVDEPLDPVVGVVGRAGLRDPPILARAPPAGLRRRLALVLLIAGSWRIPARASTPRATTSCLVAIVAGPVPPAGGHSLRSPLSRSIIHDCHRLASPGRRRRHLFEGRMRKLFSVHSMGIVKLQLRSHLCGKVRPYPQSCTQHSPVRERPIHRLSRCCPPT